MSKDFPGAFDALRQILVKHSAGMIVQADSPTDYILVTPSIGPNRRPIGFGAVLLKKSAVTYHLFPLYFNPKLQAAVSADLTAAKAGEDLF